MSGMRVFGVFEIRGDSQAFCLWHIVEEGGVFRSPDLFRLRFLILGSPLLELDPNFSTGL